jgi:hypothetical protein
MSRTRLVELLGFVLEVLVVSVSRAGVPARADPLGLPVIPSLGKAWSGSTQTVERLVGVNQMGRPRHRGWGS